VNEGAIEGSNPTTNVFGTKKNINPRVYFVGDWQ
jgi:hypothetical protein